MSVMGHQSGSHREAQTTMQQAKRLRCIQADAGLLVEEVQRDIYFFDRYLTNHKNTQRSNPLARVLDPAAARAASFHMSSRPRAKGVGHDDGDEVFPLPGTRVPIHSL